MHARARAHGETTTGAEDRTPAGLRCARSVEDQEHEAPPPPLPRPPGLAAAVAGRSATGHRSREGLTGDPTPSSVQRPSPISQRNPGGVGGRYPRPISPATTIPPVPLTLEAPARRPNSPEVPPGRGSDRRASPLNANHAASEQRLSDRHPSEALEQRLAPMCLHRFVRTRAAGTNPAPCPAGRTASSNDPPPPSPARPCFQLSLTAVPRPPLLGYGRLALGLDAGVLCRPLHEG